MTRYIIFSTISKSIHNKPNMGALVCSQACTTISQRDPHKGIIYSRAGNTPQLEIYSNADFTNPTDAKSISGYACIIDSTCITWSSKKQGTVALSTTKAEYIALTHAVKQMMWICRLLDKIGLEQRDPTPIRCDNLSAITITHHATSHANKAHQNLLSFYL